MHEEIQRRAYALWEADGRPDGQDQTYWFKAVAAHSSVPAESAKSLRKRTTRNKKAA